LTIIDGDTRTDVRFWAGRPTLAEVTGDDAWDPARLENAVVGTFTIEVGRHDDPAAGRHRRTHPWPFGDDVTTVDVVYHAPLGDHASDMSAGPPSSGHADESSAAARGGDPHEPRPVASPPSGGAHRTLAWSVAVVLLGIVVLAALARLPPIE
jgi:hypothetical protein